MANALAKTDPTMLALMHGATHKGHLQPFSREILLAECHLSGTLYRDLVKLERKLKAGSDLTLLREPVNPHDEWAIRVFDAAGHPLGYIPRITNVPLARLMDAGKQLLARLEAKTRHGDWLKLEISVHLRDY
jgi:hypothetical protein